jgi:hypothetical protein
MGLLEVELIIGCFEIIIIIKVKFFTVTINEGLKIIVKFDEFLKINKKVKNTLNIVWSLS